MRDLLSNRSPLIRSDGSPVRDYMYIDDAVAAYVRTAEVLAVREQIAGTAFNFSLGQPLTVLEMLSRIADAVGNYIEPTLVTDSESEIQSQHLDSSRARAQLGWRPQVSINEGLQQTAAWYREHFTGSPPIGTFERPDERAARATRLT